MSITTFSGYSHATTAKPSCLDNNHLVCITEAFSHQTVSNGNVYNFSTYTITNNSDQKIYAFGVTNTNGLSAYLAADFTGWSSTTLSEASWDRTQKILRFTNNSDINSVWATGTNDIVGYDEIGSFSSLFGPSVNEQNKPLYANFYWNSGNSNPLTPGVTLNQFYFNGLPESNFVALDINGSVIASSLTSALPVPDTGSPVAAVPEPQTYLMLLIGMIFITFKVKKHDEHNRLIKVTLNKK